MIRLQALATTLLVGCTRLWGADAGAGALVKGELNPSARCSKCHVEIHSMWQHSLHNSSATDPIFETSYLKAFRETGGEARKFCYRCHAPGLAMAKDKESEALFLSEGITCDYCHSIVSVDLGHRDQPFEVRLDGIKRGPLADAASPVHRVAASPLHETSEFCAGCHEYSNDRGIPIFSTYTEWKTSPQAAEGKTCLKCHMPQTTGQTVRPGLGKDRKVINLHNISGGHSAEQVTKAATVKILSVKREPPSSVIVEVEVANIGSGHRIPTGLPTRRLTLEVILYSGNRQIRRFERSYQKRLLDEHGDVIVLDHRTILNADKILEDNRLFPGERRVEKFVGTVPRHSSIRAEAVLTYIYEPEIILRQEMSIVMASDKQSP